MLQATSFLHMVENTTALLSSMELSLHWSCMAIAM